RGTWVPVTVSGTIVEGGVRLPAHTLEAFLIALEHCPVMSIGLNCALGPKQIRSYLEILYYQASCYVFCYPDGGMPDGMGGFDCNPDEFSDLIESFAKKGWVNIVGGCCGTSPAYISKVAEKVKGYAPRTIPEIPRYSTYSGS